jgi:hypothetical protein
VPGEGFEPPTNGLQTPFRKNPRRFCSRSMLAAPSKRIGAIVRIDDQSFLAFGPDADFIGDSAAETMLRERYRCLDESRDVSSDSWDEAQQSPQRLVFLPCFLSKFSSQRRATGVSLDRDAPAGTIGPNLVPAIGFTSAGHAG